MIGSIYKNINYSDARVTKFTSHATVIVDSLLDNQGVRLYDGNFSNYKYSYSDVSDPSNLIVENYYSDIIHHSVNSLFYDNFQFRPVTKFGEYNKFQKRNINKTLTLLSVPRKLYIEQITPLTVDLSMYISASTVPSFNFEDDGYGNLIDKAIKNDLFDDIYQNLDAWYSFDEGFLYTNDINNVYPNSNIVIDHSKYFREGTYYNVTWSEELKNSFAVFNGTNSYIDIPHNEINFNSSFAISFLIKANRNNDVILCKSDGTTNLYPFKFQLNNSGYLEVLISDGFNVHTLTTTSQIVGINWKHILFQYNSITNTIELIVNGGLEQSLSVNLNGGINNKYNTVIGRYGDTYYSGSLDELMIFNKILTPTQYLELATRLLSPSDLFNYYAGNVFYSLGIIVITHNRYQTVNNLSDYLLQFNSTRSIYEHEYICNIEPNEFNNTYNPSILMQDTTIIKSDFLAEEWNPYVSSIGLYDDSLNLIAIAKVSSPIKIPVHNKLNFIIRFDLVDDNIFELFPPIFIQSNFTAESVVEGDLMNLSIDIKNIGKIPASATVIFKIPLLGYASSQTKLIFINDTEKFSSSIPIPVGEACQVLDIFVQNSAKGKLEVPIHSVARMMESNCVWLHQNGFVEFSGLTINQTTFTKQGTANVHISDNKIICDSGEMDQGTLYDVQFEDMFGNNYHFPMSEGLGDICYNTESVNTGVLTNYGRTIQSEYHYNMTYGCTKIETDEGILYVPYDKNKQKIHTV